VSRSDMIPWCLQKSHTFTYYYILTKVIMSEILQRKKEMKDIPDSYHRKNGKPWIKSEKFTQTKLF